MNRRGFLLSGLMLSAVPAWAAPDERFARGVLWRVSKKGVAPSHVFGTIHVADPRLAELPPAVRRAFGGAKSLMLEFLPDAYSKERFVQAALFLDHQTLEQKIGTEDFQRALEHLQPIGLPREFVNRLKPWGVLLNLRGAAEKDGSPLEIQLLARARARRIPLLQIEEVEEQIFTFDEFPMESQVALLKHSLTHRDELVALAERTLDAYLTRDLAAIWELREKFMARYPEIAAHQAVMTKRVVHDRSVVMALRMQRELRRGAAFIALGALHLYGDKGVLALLEEDGYRSTRVY
ncbi:MAG: TraB/GumN family protein [Betaproteobacteria bacterium]|nr:MAG: TraB/GumN family protein [Betaproteobacteria bacterium]